MGEWMGGSMEMRGQGREEAREWRETLDAWPVCFDSLSELGSQVEKANRKYHGAWAGVCWESWAYTTPTHPSGRHFFLS